MIEPAQEYSMDHEGFKQLMDKKQGDIVKQQQTQLLQLSRAAVPASNLQGPHIRIRSRLDTLRRCSKLRTRGPRPVSDSCSRSLARQ